MKPFIPSKLEAHLIRQHGTSPAQISSLRERHPKDAEAIAQRSHQLLHATGAMTEEHDHD
jgi:hypothetical protein